MPQLWMWGRLSYFSLVHIPLFHFRGVWFSLGNPSHVFFSVLRTAYCASGGRLAGWHPAIINAWLYRHVFTPDRGCVCAPQWWRSLFKAKQDTEHEASEEWHSVWQPVETRLSHDARKPKCILHSSSLVFTNSTLDVHVCLSKNICDTC